jgi:dienelactone hydrolase
MSPILLGLLATALAAAAAEPPFCQIPAEFAQGGSGLRDVLRHPDGREVRTATQWATRRAEISAEWHEVMGAWPQLLSHPRLTVQGETLRQGIRQQKVVVELARGQSFHGYLLLPPKWGPRPAVFVPFYDPETSVGLSDKPRRDFAWQLAQRGFVALAVGCPGGDARKPVLAADAHCQPLSYLGYLAANAWQALADLPQVDAQRIGIVGHSYGGKWAMFGSCLHEKYAAAVWSDPGIVFQEDRQSINYQEPWYLGSDPAITRLPGLVRPESPRTGAYKTLIQRGMNLHELHCLMAPRPFLVSGGIEDPPSRWVQLKPALEVNALLGAQGRVAMTNRALHEPSAESNAQICDFLCHWLRP